MKCISPRDVWHGSRHYEVPCMKCLPCLSSRRNDWTIRLLNEHKHSTGSVFLTLTYSPKYLPKDGRLKKKHFQLFMKRLRKKTKERLRYYAVGEYGSKHGRPHYHLLLFNARGLSRTMVEQAWSVYTKDGKLEPIGDIHVGQVNEASVAYTLKYMVQPKDKDTFSCMSRGYGLGAQYLTDAMVAWHREDDRNYILHYGTKRRLPRFYKEKIFYHEDVKRRIRMKSRLESLWLHNKQKRKLRESGIQNVEEYMTIQRNLVIARIQSKVAFTQTL